MTSLLTYPFENISRKYILSEDLIKIHKITLDKLEWINPVAEQDKFIVPLSEHIDNFDYPTLNELRKQFEATGLYSQDRIDKIIKAYERLPKYRAQSRRAPRSRKRSS